MKPLNLLKGLLVPAAGLLAISLVMAVVMGSQEFTPRPVEADHLDAGAPSGEGVQPVGVHGNPECSDVLSSGEFLFSHKTGTPQDETIPLMFNGLTGNLTIDVTDSTFNFSFTGDFVAVGVIVKGGPNANFYDYRPDGEDADTGLHAPVNPNNNRFYGLSHIEFCIIEAAGDVSVEKTPDDGTANAGDDITFSIVVTSNGPGTATNVTLTDNLPDDGLDWSETSDPSDSCEIAGAVGSQVLSCDFGDLAPEAVRTVEVTSPTGSDDCGVVENTATVAADNDSDDTNNSDVGDIEVFCPDVSVEKTPDGGTVDAGQDAVFTIVVTNEGPGQSDSVTLSDTLPNSGLSWSFAGGADDDDCSIAAGTPQLLSCDFGTLADGATRTVKISSPTDAEDCDTIPNTVNITADGDTNAGNNSDNGSIDVKCGALLINKEVKVPGNGTPQGLEGASFRVLEDDTTNVVAGPNDTDVNGQVCFDDLEPGTYDVEEVSAPDGYAISGDAVTEDVVVVGGTDCDGLIQNKSPNVTITNDPLTNISIDVFAQDPGATESSIECFNSSDESIGGDEESFSDPADLDIIDLRPGTYTCVIIIDP